jgi:hypothetical protein
MVSFSLKTAPKHPPSTELTRQNGHLGQFTSISAIADRLLSLRHASLPQSPIGV